MPWTYQSATFRGNNKAVPVRGDRVVVRVNNAGDVREITFTYSANRTPIQFRTMVRAEVIAALAELNVTEASTDATADFSPDP